MSDPASSAMPHAEWLAEFERRGKLDCKFVCPRCGLASSPSDFEAIGAAPERATKECIGRHTKERGCDWAAYGLFKGPAFVKLDDGTQIAVFEFADEAHR